MNVSEFDYALPPDCIAQTPVEPRDSARMLVIYRQSSQLEHRHFYDLPGYLRPGDLLVANDSRVLPARLHGRKRTGGAIELLLLHRQNETTWETLAGGKGLRPGTGIALASADGSLEVEAVIVAETPAGGRIVQFAQPIEPLLARLGDIPLPPYIHEPLSDPERYQTVYARVAGSAAAPTAGLHFTSALIERCRQAGGDFAFVTLHVGLDTFRPVQVERVDEHIMHAEFAQLSAETASAINCTHAAGGRVIAVGTTAVRVLESAAAVHPGEPLQAYSDWTRLFITPGFHFQVVDALITNFHLPRSTLLMLVSAFAGRAVIAQAYQQAIQQGYRFFSFGDATLMLP